MYNQQWSEEDFSCCQDMWHCEAEYKNTKRSRFYVISCTILKGIIRSFSLARKYIKLLVKHKYFQQGILLAILVNTLSMGIEYHDQPEYLTTTVELSNIVFSAIFAVEMILKVIAEGPFGYIANGFNVFDGVIVILRYEFHEFISINVCHCNLLCCTVMWLMCDIFYKDIL